MIRLMGILGIAIVAITGCGPSEDPASTNQGEAPGARGEKPALGGEKSAPVRQAPRGDDLPTKG